MGKGAFTRSRAKWLEGGKKNKTKNTLAMSSPLRKAITFVLLKLMTKLALICHK